MTVITKGGILRPGSDSPARRVLLALLLLIAVSACEQRGTVETVTATADSDEVIELKSADDIAGRLVRRLVRDPDGSHVAVEIDYEVLRGMMTAGSRDERLDGFRDPLLAARLFAPHVGVSANADYSMTQRSWQVEEASGLFIAMVRVKQGDETVDMRMISEPDSIDQPTLWLLNDYRK